MDEREKTEPGGGKARVDAGRTLSRDEAQCSQSPRRHALGAAGAPRQHASADRHQTNQRARRNRKTYYYVVRAEDNVLPNSCLTGPQASPTPSATPSPTPAQALNLSTRMRVETGDNVGIGGFIIGGSGPKHVVVRGLGPTLTKFGFSSSQVLADPTLEIHGPGGFATVVNNNWRDSQESQIENSGLAPENDV